MGALENNAISITNSQDKRNITVSKSWANADGTTTWPADVEVVVKLTADDEEVAGKTATLSADQPSYTFENLPTHKNVNGIMTEIEYDVVEVSVAGYTTQMGALENNAISITNTQATTEIEVEKKWKNADDSETWPEGMKIEVQLLDGDEAIEGKTATLSSAQTSYKFEGLPTHKLVDGEMVEIKYGVDESIIDGYSSTIGALTDGKITITNVQDVGIVKVTKIFEGIDATLLPDDFVITNDYNDAEFTYDNAANKDTADGITTAYEWLIEDVPVDTVITFTESGAEVEGYTLTATSTTIVCDAVIADEVVTAEFKNTYDKKVSAMVKKVWKDDGNRDGLRPTGLKIELLADGEATGKYANLNAENNWLDRIEDLPKCKDGKDITYTWKEPSVVGYTLTGTATSGELTTLTNTHVPEKTKVQVKKVWVDSGKHPSDIKVQLFADGKATDKVATLNAANNWTYSWDDLCKNANNEGLSREIRYTVAETEIPEGYVAKITGDASTGFVITNTLETGKLVIQKEFDIKEQEDKPDEDEMTTEIEVVKIWDDNDNKDGNRPESITVHLFAGGEEVRTAKLSADNGWKRKFGDLPKFVKGRPIQYTVTEDPVDMYVTEIYGFTIRNRYQPALTSATIRKVWDDEENKLQNRPLSIVMTLKNGGTVIRNVVLNEQNGWTATITGLPAKLNGEPAAYTWTEQAVLGYVQESTTTNGTVTVITNKLWTRPDTPTQGRTPKFPGETVDIEEYDTPLGIEVVINHVGDCFD